MSIQKTVSVNYDCWAKLRNYQTLLEEHEPGKSYSDIIEDGLHLLIKQFDEKYGPIQIKLQNEIHGVNEE